MNNLLPDSSELSGVLFSAPFQCKDSDLSRNGRESLTKAPWRGGKSLAVELAKSSEGRGSATEDGTKASERSFSGANWL